jgi:hypothetical protein
LILTLGPGTTSADWADIDNRYFDFTIVAFNSAGSSKEVPFTGDIYPPGG